VDDLLEVSRITSGKISLRREVLDIATVLQNAIDTSGPLIEKGRHKLTVSLASEPVLVDADAVRLAQVFANLLNNAAKYTDEKGHIQITLKREGGDAVISVRDNGVGILPEMLPRVFDMFAQIDRTLNRAQGGLGIGLALAKKLVELHGGRMEVASDGPGKGSEFVVRLASVEACDKAAAQDVPGGSNQRAVRRRRILVVDDNRDAALSLTLLLQTFRHTTRVAFDGAQAMEMVADFHPEVVLLDIGLPHMNGYEVARRLRHGSDSAPLTLIALTGWGQEDDRRKAKDAGFDYHFTKPVDIDALITLLETAGSLAR
jgi:CheY-like chemotaxis protein